MNRTDSAALNGYGAHIKEQSIMPRYTFRLWDDNPGVENDVEVALPNSGIAYEYACQVASELMHHREQQTRHWHLEVYHEDGDRLFDIPFVEHDRTIDHSSPEYRALVEQTAQRTRALKDAYYEAELTHREARALVARSRGKPYLAISNGRKVIR